MSVPHGPVDSLNSLRITVMKRAEMAFNCYVGRRKESALTFFRRPLLVPTKATQ